MNRNNYNLILVKREDKELYDSFMRQNEEYNQQVGYKEHVTLGAHYLGETLTASTIYNYYGISSFYIKSNIISQEDIEEMKMITTIKFQSGAPMYLARAYTAKLGDMKIYVSNNGNVYRCLIVDLYPKQVDGILQMEATIDLIDLGQIQHGVKLEDRLYDVPQLLSRLKLMKPESELARLYLGKPIPLSFKDRQIDNEFCFRLCNELERSNNNLTIKILDYQDKFYHVDIITRDGNSMIDQLKQKFRPLLRQFDERRTTGAKDLASISRQNINLGRGLAKRAPARMVVSKQEVDKPQIKYHSALHYFKTKLPTDGYRIIAQDENDSYLKQRFLRVRVISWDEPNSYYLIPDDTNYASCHEDFKSYLTPGSGLFDETFDETTLERPYSIGQKCVFKSTGSGTLGEWLRGIIIETPPLIDEHNQIIDSSWPSQLEGGKINYNEFVQYRIYSFDYGFKCTVAANKIRPVKDINVFMKKGSWSLRCRLFGINPLVYGDQNEETNFSDTCLFLADQWMRDRILDEGRYSFFQVLFRTDLFSITDEFQWKEPSAEISLFHRHEPPYTIEDCMLPVKRKSRFDCLNNYLVSRGVASDYMPNLKKLSNIDLDEFTINLLVPHDKI